MNIQEVLDTAYAISNTTATQVSNADAIKYANIEYRKFVQQINTELLEDTYCEIFTGDLVSGQSSYSIPSQNSLQVGAFSVSGLAINLAEQVLQSWTATSVLGSNSIVWTGTNFNVFAEGDTIVLGSYAYVVSLVTDSTHLRISTPAKENISWIFYAQKNEWQRVQTTRLGNNTIEYNKAMYSVGETRASIYDTDFFITPVPKFDGIGSWKVYGTVDPIDLVLSPASTPIFSPDLDYVLIFAVATWLYRRRQMFNEAQLMDAQTDKSKREAYQTLSERFTAPEEVIIVNTDNLA